MSEKYVVVQTEYQYNDEYLVAQTTGGIPIGVFRTKKQAESFINLKTKNWLVDQGFAGLVQYSDGYLCNVFHRKPDYLTSVSESDFLDSIPTNADNLVWKKLTATEIRNLDENQLDDLVRCLELKPYTAHVVK